MVVPISIEVGLFLQVLMFLVAVGVAVKDTASIGKKWAEVTPMRAGQYEQGVRAPTRDYAANTMASEPAWTAGVNAAIQNKRFTKGVAKAGNEKWQRRAIALGPARYGPGVQAAQNDYETAFAPYREAIASTNLPPRGPRRSPQNLQRVNAIVQAISAKKEAMSKGA